MSETDLIAVVGMGCVYPGAPDVETFWDNIVAGRDAIIEAPPDRVDPRFFAGDDGNADHLTSTRGGFVQGEALTFEPGRFGIMPVTVEGAEPDQMMALKTAAAAVDDAGGLGDVPHERIGVVLGRGGYLTPALARLDQRVRTSNQLLDTLRCLLPEVDDDRLVAVKEAFADQLGDFRPESAIGLVPNLAASRIANRFDFGGAAYTIDAACASFADCRRCRHFRSPIRALRRCAGRGGASLPRRHPLVGLLPTRCAQPVGGDPSVQPPCRRHPGFGGYRHAGPRAVGRCGASRPPCVRDPLRVRCGQRRPPFESHEPAGGRPSSRPGAGVPRRRGRPHHHRPDRRPRYRDARRRQRRAGDPPVRVRQTRTGRRPPARPRFRQVEHRPRHAGGRRRRSHQVGAGRPPRRAAADAAR